MGSFVRDTYWPSFAWGLAVLASFIGWGSLAARWPRAFKRGRLGIAGGLGNGGGDRTGRGCWLLFGAANATVLLLIAVAGCAFAILWFRPREIDGFAILIFACTLVLWYAPAVAARNFEPYDDYLAYFPFVRRLLETGTLIEPFGFRRLTTYGGQSLLNAMSILAGSEKNMNLLDSGMAMLVLAGLIYGMLRRLARAPVAAACTFAALLIPIARHNTMSQATGVVLWVALFQSVRMRKPAMAGLVIAALCAMRSNYIAPAAIVLFLILISEIRLWWRAAVVAGAAIFPWALLLYHSSGTFIYPLFGGFQRAGYSYAAGAGWAETGARPGTIVRKSGVSAGPDSRRDFDISGPRRARAVRLGRGDRVLDDSDFPAVFR